MEQTVMTCLKYNEYDDAIELLRDEYWDDKDNVWRYKLGTQRYQVRNLTTEEVYAATDDLIIAVEFFKGLRKYGK